MKALIKVLSKEQQAGLGTANLFFLLVFLFGYSPLSLLFLFIAWLVLTGVTLHLFFLATSEDDYRGSFSYGEDQAAARIKTADHLTPLEERDEFVAPKTLLKVLLSIYGVILTLKCQYTALEQARNPRKTTRFLLLLPVVICIIYFVGISDTFVAWVFVNYVILLPSWPAVKNAIVLPQKLISFKDKVKRLLVPRFLRSSDAAATSDDDDDSKLKRD